MKWFYNMKVSTKILLGFLIVSFIAGIMGIQGISNINKINNLDTQLYENMTAPLGDVIDLSNSFNNIRGYLRDVLLKEDLSEIQAYNNKVKEASSKFDSSLDKLAKTTLTTEGEQVIKKIKASKTKYLDIVNKIIQLKIENKREEAINLLYSEGKPALE